MPVIRQHIPSFVAKDGLPIVAAFTDVQQLLEIQFVVEFSKLPFFYRYSLATFGEPMLMAEYDNGRVWHVVGVIEGWLERDRHLFSGLPEWEKK